jgi:hypothetical protein
VSNLARVIHRTRCRWSCMSVWEKCSHLTIYIKRKRWVIAHEHLGDKTEKTEKWERYDRVRATHVDAEKESRDSFRLDHHRDLTHFFRMRSILIKRKQNEALLNFVTWLIKQVGPAKRKTKTFPKSNFLRQQVSACSERNDASKKKEIWWDRRLSYDWFVDNLREDDQVERIVLIITEQCSHAEVLS